MKADLAVLSHKNRIKIIVSASFISMTAALVLIGWNSPARGYELSVYTSVSPVAWVFLLVPMVVGIAIVTSEATRQRESSMWGLGFFVLLLCNSIVLLLPEIRGYYYIAITDPFGQLQDAGTVVATGHVPNYYPFMHVLGAQTYELAMIDLSIVLKLLPVFFTLFSMIFLYLMALEASQRRIHALFAAAAGTALLYSYYHVSAYPQVIGLLMLPFAFYLYFKVLKSPKLEFKVLFILFLLIFPFTHPAAEVVLIFCLAGAGLVLFMLNDRKRARNRGVSIYRGSVNLALMSAVVFFVWFASNSAFDYYNYKFFSWLTGNIAVVPRASEVATVTALSPMDLIVLSLKLYGDQIILLAFSLVAMVIIFRQFVAHRSQSKCMFIVSLFVLISGPVYIVIFWSLNRITVGRLLGANTVAWIIPVLAAFALYKIVTVRGWPRRVTVGFVICVLASSSLLGVVTVYRSPWVDQPSMQVTRMDLSGTDWMGSNVPGYAHPETPEAAPIGVLGWAAPTYAITIPDHFGYPDNGTLGQALRESFSGPSVAYILMTEKFAQAINDPVLSKRDLSPPGLSVIGFSTDDVTKLETDTSVNLLYQNGQFQVLQVNTG